MSNIEFIKLDVTRVAMGIVAHGVNCQHVMGSGVAKAIRETWPVAYHAYMKQPKGKTMLGNCHLVRVDEGRDDLFVANLYTQLFYGYGGGAYADVDSIRSSFDQCAKYADMYELPIYMPRIGCGLGGLTWDKVEPCIIDAALLYDVNVYVCDLE